MSHQHFLEVFGGSCKARSHYSNIISTLMRPVGLVKSIQCGSSSFLLRYFSILCWLNCHAPNLILGFVTMTGMLILSLNLILTRTNLTFTKASLFPFILVSLLKWYNFSLDIQSIYIVLQPITKSTSYSKSWISHNTSLNTLRYTTIIRS